MPAFCLDDSKATRVPRRKPSQKETREGEAPLLQFPETEELKAIERSGASWASSCVRDLFSEMDLHFFSNQYRPFFETLTRVDGRLHTTLADFDPFGQHERCRALFAPAFGSEGASMISSSMGTSGRVPDFKFAAFEAGAIRAIRHTWQTGSDRRSEGEDEDGGGTRDQENRLRRTNRRGPGRSRRCY